MYAGCASDTQCQFTFPNNLPVIVCEEGFCLQSCATAEECSLSTSGAYGPERYACDQRVCVYLGCGSDALCQQSEQTADVACAVP